MNDRRYRDQFPQRARCLLPSASAAPLHPRRVPDDYPRRRAAAQLPARRLLLPLLLRRHIPLRVSNATIMIILHHTRLIACREKKHLEEMIEKVSEMETNFLLRAYVHVQFPPPVLASAAAAPTSTLEAFYKQHCNLSPSLSQISYLYHGKDSSMCSVLASLAHIPQARSVLAFVPTARCRYLFILP